MANKQITGRSFVSFLVTAFALGAVLGVTACGNPNQLPVGENFPTVNQPIVESAADWQLIAADTWDHLTKTLAAGGFNETSIGLESPEPQTQFSKAMDGFLFTEAVKHGVADTPDAQFTLTYSVQVIHYEPLPGTTTTTNGSTNDGWNGNDQTSEMILTISVTDGTTVRIRDSKVFYIDDADTGLYEVHQNEAAETKISNSPLVSSNWYADNPHEVEPIARQEANTFALMVNPAAGPIHNMSEAMTIAAAHCGKVGLAQAKYMDQSYPTNDRNQIRVEYQCL